MTNVYCSQCGSKNKAGNIHCKKCNSTLKTNKIIYGQKINSIEELITPDNYQKLYDTYFTPSMYNAILDEIIRIGADKFTYNENESALNNIIHIAEQYVDIYSKHKGSSAGFYIANQIYFEERNTEAEKIGTIIHELTHHLYAEIYEQIMMYALQVEKTKYIEAFVQMSQSPVHYQLLNEYVAHTTEGQFIIHGCQNYGSFIKIKEENNINLDECQDLLSLGRAISDDISMILENFIDENLRKKIIQQYTIDNVPRTYNELEFEEIEKISDDVKPELMGSILRSLMEACLREKNVKKALESYIGNFN